MDRDRGELECSHGTAACFALERAGRSQPPCRHSLGCSCAVMAVLVPGRGFWDPGAQQDPLQSGLGCLQGISFLSTFLAVDIAPTALLCSGSSAFFSLISVTFYHAAFDVKTASAQLQGCSLRREGKCAAHRIAQGLSISFWMGVPARTHANDL